MSADGEKTTRRRLSIDIDVDEAVHKMLPPARQRKQRHQFIHEALLERARPSVQFVSAPGDVTARDQLREFVKATTRELWMVGMTFGFTVDACADVLEELVDRQVTVNVILPQAHVEPGSALEAMLALRLGGLELVPAMLRQAQASTEFFQRLRQRGAAHSADVQLRTCAEPPMVGILARDEGTANRRMRISFYTSIAPLVRHPHLEIDPHTQVGEAAYRSFDAYLKGLLMRTNPVPG